MMINPRFDLPAQRCQNVCSTSYAGNKTSIAGRASARERQRTSSLVVNRVGSLNSETDVTENKTGQLFELLVCTSKTCKKQGSQQLAKFAEDLALPDVAVRTVGCLGVCGAGPNMVLLPDKLKLSHIGTLSKLTDLLREVCGQDISASLLKAAQLRTAGNAEARSGDYERAEELYTEALELNVGGTRHMLLSNRSGVRLARGDKEGAAADADAAAEVSPPGFTNAYIRQVEARAASGDYRGAFEALEAGGNRDPTFCASTDYQTLARQLSRVVIRA